MIPQGCWWWLWGTSAASRTAGFVHRVMDSTRPNTGLMGSGMEWGGGGIKRMGVSWTLTKKLLSFAGPGEIKRREVELDPQESPEEIKNREMELGSESWTSFASVVTQQ